MTDLLMQPVGIITGYVIPALIVLTVVVFIHELGHFLVARWCGIRVAAFSIGFGRELFGFNDRRGTRWKVSLIPLGGYVRFEGDENAASIPDQAELDQVPPERRAGLFHFAALWRRAAVVAAGPIANFILAIVVFAVLFGTVGKPMTTPRADSVVAGSPAEQAGIRPGDRIVAIDGQAIESFSEIQRIVTLSAGSPLTITVERGGERMDLTATPRREQVPDGFGGTQRVGILGISRTMNAGDVVFETFGPVGAVREGVRETWEIIDRTLTYVGRLFRGRETADQLSGPLRVVQVSGTVASSGGAVGLVHLMAILSVSIGLLNLFPIPMLDGGHLVFYAIEAIRGRPLSARAQELGFRIGFALVLMLFMFVTFNDIVKISGI
ncbi:RIP metalloprotease RseP [Propylenella binzhouense]|uniref:Zinc metalloprotease n=1 Tax=Propylenella binzhouense TaxID=2555902 RepID=A0A964T3F2_9HYPH|nr:RIP metalloprotease RseP [Propylenella binzhouense]MYZ47728.1 RIP metalloprotease RseP [Propylenella binzhouense]